MLKVLDKYQQKGSFTFSTSDNLNDKCNAPRRSSGIYIIYKDEIEPRNLIYIGISGRENKGGEIKHRMDGLGGRIVKGKQFGEARRKSWPKRMKEDGITIIHVKWFVTYGDFNQDFPRPLEHQLLKAWQANTGSLPLWNKET